MGDAGSRDPAPVSPDAPACEIAAHQAIWGVGVAPAGIRTDMTTVPLGMPAGHCAPLSVVKVT
jgi:hypothetical protein